MLTIDYEVSTNWAYVTGADLPDADWAECKSVLERCYQVRNTAARTVAVPWWNFLLIRLDLAYIIRKYSISITLSDSARNLLVSAREREQAYRSCREQVWNANDLRASLARNNFKRELTPEQLRNVLSLLRFPAAATFSVPGAGKTTEALAYFLVQRQPETRLLVVAPKNAFPAWEEQLDACVTGHPFSIVRLQGGEVGVMTALEEEPTISLITYQQLYRSVPLIAAYLTSHSCFVYLDESHRMKKGFSGAYGSSVLSLSHLPICKLILSGTPMPNSTADLVPQFTFLYPEISVTEATVVDRIKPVYVRTTKAELGLREPDRFLVPVKMSDPQLHLYELLKSEAKRQLGDLRAADRIRLRAFGRSVIRLLQVTTEPALLAKSELNNVDALTSAIADGPSPKIVEACRIARNLAREGHKSIIWSQFVQTVETLADMLADLGAEFIHGQVESDADEENTESREAKVRRFHDDSKCMVMVANPAACSEGISLHTVCHHAIYLDRSYNAAHYLQSEDRIHRLGLLPQQCTTVLILHTPNSIDDSVKRRLEWKIDRMRSVLDDPSLNIEPISFDDELGFDMGDFEDIRRLLTEV